MAISVKHRSVIAVIAILANSVAWATDHLTLQLGWMAEAEFGGYFQAQQAGFYRANGIEMGLKLGSPQSNTMQLLLAGRADIIVASTTDALNAAREGLPVMVVAAIFQRDPRVIISHTNVGNDTLESMRGKPIMIAPSDRVTFWPFLKQKYGFTDEQLRPYTFNAGPFLAGQSAIQQGYITSERFALQMQGAHLNVILLSDHGYDTYAQVIITTRRLAEQSPDLVQRFVNATLKGWHDYLYADASAANQFIKQNNPEMSDAQIAYSIAKIKEVGLVDSGETTTNGIGAMSDGHWKVMVEKMIDLGMYPRQIDYRSIYTLRFVNQKVGL